MEGLCAAGVQDISDEGRLEYLVCESEKPHANLDQPAHAGFCEASAPSERVLQAVASSALLRRVVIVDGLQQVHADALTARRLGLGSGLRICHVDDGCSRIGSNAQKVRAHISQHQEVRTISRLDVVSSVR